MKVAKWGNSLAVRLPSAVVDLLELKDGDEIVVGIAGRRALEIAKSPDRAELLRRLEAFEGRWPADFKFDRDEANER
ncbi:MAG TPA: AbrB/MazE/SpoVT family DNA-binding domain-containing protein [Caulobacteraceae bacterium]|jgi:antitoxin MazE